MCRVSAVGVLIENFGGILDCQNIVPRMPSWGAGGWLYLYFNLPLHLPGNTVAQWLRRCATIRKVAGSIPAGVSEFFIDIKSFRSHYGPGVDSNKNEYQEYFLGVKATGA